MVSIHTPTKGVTAQPTAIVLARLFQSTHPRRVWPWRQLVNDAPVGVSIHTPTKGVTWASSSLAFSNTVSIHTPTKGVTSATTSVVAKFLVSIHTPTKGVTTVASLCKRIDRFQSTHPRRVWLHCRLGSKAWKVFQSTHPRRVWLYPVKGGSVL